MGKKAIFHSKENAKAVYVGLKLNKRTDADILDAIGSETVRQQELKRLIRLGICEQGNTMR